MSSKIIDIFLFCNELDMLELRLMEHQEVDLFIIVESRKTFTNNDKALNYEQNKNRYKKWHDKIMYLVIDSYDDFLVSAWEREYYTRNYGLLSVKDELLEKGILDDNTLIISSDLDEIINKEVLKMYKNIDFDDGIKLAMDLYYYNCNWKFATPWTWAKIIKYKSLELIYQCKLQNLRNNHNLPMIHNAGWHLSYFLTIEQISFKLKSFSHTEYSNEQYTNYDNIKSAIDNGKDLFGRNECVLVQATDTDNLPTNVSVLPEMFQRTCIDKYGNDFYYTNHWFEAQRPIHEKFLHDYVKGDECIKILEIGSHEGRSSVFFSSYLTSGSSSLICIDPFSLHDTTSPVNDDTYEIYKHNIKLTGKDDKIYLEKDYSINVLIKMLAMNQHESIDYILIDGSHLTKDVLTDAVLSFELLKPGGVMFFDDYLGGDVNSLQYSKIGIDSFINCYRNKIEILHIGYHYVIKKI